MSASLKNLLDICSEFTRGQDFVADIAFAKPKVKKAKKKVVSQEELEYAKYIGYDSGDNTENHLEHTNDQNSQLPMDYQRSFNSNNNNNKTKDRSSNHVGVGRGRLLQADFLPMGIPTLEPVKQTRQELNDRVIGEQLREMGIGVSNNDIETEFDKKFRTQSVSPMLDSTSSGSSQSQLEEIGCKKKRESMKLYVPPHLKSKASEEPTTSSVCHFDNKNVEVEKREQPLLLAYRPRYVYEVSDESNDDVANFLNSDVSDVENKDSDRNCDILNVDKKSDRVEELSSSTIKFKIVSNERIKTKSVGRNALINGLLNRNLSSPKHSEENLNSVESDQSCKSATGISLMNNSEGFKCFDRDTGHKNLKDVRYEEDSSSIYKNYSKDASCSKSSSPSSILHNSSYDTQQPIYFTAPVSGKIVMINTSKSYMDIIPKSHKPHKITVGDFMVGNRLPKSSCSTPSDLESSLNPLADEFCPNSSSGLHSSDSENFYLDDKEFPPL